MDEANRNHAILASWLGFNSDQKGIKKMLEEKHVVKDEKQKQDEHAKNWKNLAAFVRQMR